MYNDAKQEARKVFTVNDEFSNPPPFSSLQPCSNQMTMHYSFDMAQLDCPDTFICTRCKRDKHPIKKYSVVNDMHPGSVPPCLQQLSQVEEMLIARACPIMSVYHKHGGQRGYKGHVLNMPQDMRTRTLIFVSEEPKSWRHCSGSNRTTGSTRIS